MTTLYPMLLGKFAEYSEWGVRNIWLIDPDQRSIYVFEGKELEPLGAFYATGA